MEVPAKSKIRRRQNAWEIGEVAAHHGPDVIYGQRQVTGLFTRMEHRLI
jgi:hypothetical protein